MTKPMLWILATVLALSGTARAAEEEPGTAAVAKLRALRPDLPIEKVSPSPIPNLVTIELSGGTMLYATTDGRYLVAGDLYELGETRLINLAESKRNTERRALLAAVPESEMAVFPATGTKKASITVFTDVDCGYCRKLHQEVPDLNARGIEVRYLAYPRQGLDSEAFERMVSAWCSADRNGAITRLKRGESIPKRTCANPIERQYELGHLVGVQGTPAIIFEDGTLQPGYVPAADLAALLGL